MTDDVEPDAEPVDTPRPGTTHPHLARERALKVLFSADVRRVDPRLLLDEVATHPADLDLLDELEPDEQQVAEDEELQRALTRRDRLPLDDYTRLLVAGVAACRPAIDELLGEVAENWTVDRMPAVDRNLLRLGIYELAEQDTPSAVVIDEAVSLAVAFTGDKAPGFVNGILETVRRRVVAGEVDLVETVPLQDEEPAGPGGLGESGDPGQETEADVEAPAAATGLATADLAEVDEAAQEAYDLAVDLLEAEGPLQEPDDADEGGDDPPDAEDVPLW